LTTKHGLDVKEWVIDDEALLTIIRRYTREAGVQFSAAVAAIREIGVLTGLRIERSERGHPGEFAEVPTEQLIAELRDLGITVTVDDAPPSNAMN